MPDLSIALRGQRNLLELEITDNVISSNGLLTLSYLLQHPRSKIHELELEEKLCSTLNNATGWVAFFNRLRDSVCLLEKLYLGSNEIDDEGAAALANLQMSYNEVSFDHY